jgi:hypothetical protein
MLTGNRENIGEKPSGLCHAYGGALPLVTTDQIAALGNVLDTPIPGNGKFRR